MNDYQPLTFLVRLTTGETQEILTPLDTVQIVAALQNTRRPPPLLKSRNKKNNFPSEVICPSFVSLLRHKDVSSVGKIKFIRGTN